MTIFFFLLFVMIVVGVTIWTLVREKEESSGQPDSGTPSAHSVNDPGVSGVAPAKGPSLGRPGTGGLEGSDLPTWPPKVFSPCSTWVRHSSPEPRT